MGYESKMHIMRRVEYELPNGETRVWGDPFAEFDLCKMGYEGVTGYEFYGSTFRSIFDTDIDFDLYVNDEATREDCYDATCQYTDIDTVIDWLELSEVVKEWWRADVFLRFLKTLKEAGHDDLIVVHYGY